MLDQAVSKYYFYGVRYVRQLDELAPLVKRWKPFAPHQSYSANLVEKHKRKSAFWQKHEGKRDGKGLNRDKPG